MAASPDLAPPTLTVTLDPIESCVDGGIGVSDRVAPWPAADRLTPLGALESAIRPALMREPCLIPFSGGRDSSAVLAVAAGVARREGLPEPIPLTQRFPAVAETEEREWQELVIGHLGLREWLVEELDDELDMLGTLATDLIRRHGLIAPTGTHQVITWARHARGGSLVTGIDGDGLFNGGAYRRLRRVLQLRRRPAARDPLTIIKLAGPRALRHRRNLAALSTDVVWLRPEAEQELLRRAATEVTDEPFPWDDRVMWWSRLRSVVQHDEVVRYLAWDQNALLIQPLLDPGFLAAVSRAGGRLGFGHRTAAMQTLFGALLPDAVLSRRDKASFTRAFAGPEVRRFAETWDGSGVPDDLVDPDALRQSWLSELPDARSMLLLHAAWLARLPVGERPQPLNCSL